MIKYISRHNKDYSRYNIIKEILKDVVINKDVYILLPFSKNQFFKSFLKRNRIVNDFFISNYDTYVNDRKKITRKNPRAWWKFFQDWVNFKYSKYLIADTKVHLEYWQKLFGKFSGKYFILPVLADRSIYYPNDKKIGDKVRFIFYGSFIPLHGIDVILEAFALLEKDHLQFEAVIFGNGQTFAEMEKLHSSLKLRQVVMNGAIIPEIELAEEIRKSDVVLGIFGDSEKAKSVIPNKVYQGMACKKLVITMKSNAISEFFAETDMITCENNKFDLYEKLRSIILDPAMAAVIQKKGHSSFETLYDKKVEAFQKFLIDEVS